MDGEFRRSHPEGSNAWRSAGPKLDDFPATQEFQAANEEYSRASLAYWNSEDGLSQQRLQREYRAMFGPDGTFRIDDVPPGEYTVKVDLVRPPKLSEGNPLKFTRIADERDDFRAWLRFTVDIVFETIPFRCTRQRTAEGSPT